MSKLITARDSYDRRKSKRTGQFRSMTKEEVLRKGAGEHVKSLFLNDGLVSDAKVNGKVRTWKRDENHIEVSIKYGMYSTSVFAYHHGMDRFDNGNGKVVLVVQEGEWHEPSKNSGT